jgi:hypothetical protein
MDTHTHDLEDNHHDFILRLIRHTSTLSKSKADAEEERKERAAEAQQPWTNPAPRVRNDPVPFLFTDPMMEDEAMNDGQDDGNRLVTTTIKRLLKIQQSVYLRVEGPSIRRRGHLYRTTLWSLAICRALRPPPIVVEPHSGTSSVEPSPKLSNWSYSRRIRVSRFSVS